MKRISTGVVGIFLAVAFVATPALAGDKQQKSAAQRRHEANLPFDLPSKNQPEPATCAGRCARDKGDCDAMCKAVQNAQGGGACKKACVDTAKDCEDDCKGGGQQ